MHAVRSPLVTGGGTLRQTPAYVCSTHRLSGSCNKLANKPVVSLNCDAQQSAIRPSLQESSASSRRLHSQSANGDSSSPRPSVSQSALEVAANQHPSQDETPQTGQQEAASQRSTALTWYAAVGLSAIAALICSVDRAAISVAILPMSEEFGWSDSTKGAINRYDMGWFCCQVALRCKHQPRLQHLLGLYLLFVLGRPKRDRLASQHSKQRIYHTPSCL